MERFSLLLDRLYYTSSNLAKSDLIKQYLAETSDPDRGWAIAALGGTLTFDLFKRNLIKKLITERVDPYLFELCYDYVGETSETVAHLWPISENRQLLNRLPTLSEVVDEFKSRDKQGVSDYLVQLLDNMTAEQRWALLKLGTRGLRVGVSARFLKKSLAEYGNVPVEEIEQLWYGLQPPYEDLLAWLEGRAEKPDVSDKVTYHPVMLSHPLEEPDYKSINPEHWQAEWKYDGIRVQLVSTPEGKALFTRTGDDISHSFPELVERIDFEGVLDGELLVLRDNNQIGSFNELQQRLGKKSPTKKLITQYPSGLIIYDALALEGEPLTSLPLTKRMEKLHAWHAKHQPVKILLSEPLIFNDFDQLLSLRETTIERSDDSLIEGLMLKRKTSAYLSGRPKGHWYKWKREPMLVDAVMMYAQRGHGKRSSFYSDFTFGLWLEDKILPIGKAYSGFTDEELKKLDRWVRHNTTAKFGPVREVKKELVFEVAFDSVHESARHKSGLALRFPRISRIRWDKPANEADQLENLRKFIS